MGGQPAPDSARPPPNVSVYRARPARRMSAGIKRARTDWRRLRGVGASAPGASPVDRCEQECTDEDDQRNMKGGQDGGHRRPR